MRFLDRRHRRRVYVVVGRERRLRRFLWREKRKTKKNMKERRVFEATRRDEEDENELLDPDEIAFLPAEMERGTTFPNTTTTTTTKHPRKESSSWRRATSDNGTSTSSSINNGVEKKTSDDSDDDFRRNEEDSNDELMMKEQSPFGIRERFGDY